MKTLIVSTPIRPVPTSFPPFGSLALLQYLRKNGVDDVDFYNIDANRPTFEEAVEEIVRRKPGILGISAVVSTAYEYTRRLSAAVRERLPDILIVLGGNMGASANVLLHRTEVDLVVVGEGEVVFLNLIRKAEETRNPVDFKDVRGLALIDENGVLINTGYEPQIAADDIYDISWDDLKRTTDRFEIYFPTMDVSSMKDFHMKGDARYHDERRHGKAISSLYTAKGCVSRCTFCHRWDKGIRFIPVPVVMERLDELIRDYDVGYLNISDENFGTDRRWLKEFCGEIAKRDVLWTVGTRVTGITEEMVEMMKDAGCVAIIYGNETGSKRMLEIMEKKVSIQDNYEAMRWTIERGLRSVVQLVLGMPGECPETIRETIEYVKYCNTIDPRQNPNDLSINYAQALPGTPLYEFARSKGMIGRSLEEEEAYLLSISDRDAHDEYTTLNFTDYPKLVCETWRPLITIENNYHYVETFGLDHYLGHLLGGVDHVSDDTRSAGYYANPKRLLQNERKKKKRQVPSLFKLMVKGQWGMAMICHPVSFYHMRRFLILMVIMKNLRFRGVRRTLAMVREYLGWRLGMRGKRFTFEYKSLRRIVDRDIGQLPGDDEAMAPLRQGR